MEDDSTPHPETNYHLPWAGPDKNSAEKCIVKGKGKTHLPHDEGRGDEVHFGLYLAHFGGDRGSLPPLLVHHHQLGRTIYQTLLRDARPCVEAPRFGLPERRAPRETRSRLRQQGSGTCRISCLYCALSLSVAIIFLTKSSETPPPCLLMPLPKVDTGSAQAGSLSLRSGEPRGGGKSTQHASCTSAQAEAAIWRVITLIAGV